MSERVRNVNSTDTSRTGAAEAGADPDDENRIDFGTLFPAKGDSRRPPEWFGRALLYVALAVIVFMFCWRSWGDISYLVLDIIISLFLALARRGGGNYPQALIDFLLVEVAMMLLLGAIALWLRHHLNRQPATVAS